MKSGKVILGLLAGISAGALLGILFAPHSGQDTRKKILKAGKKYSENIKEEFDESLNVITEQFNKVKDRVSDFARQAAAKAEDLKNGTKL
jgi:gas vesicle protein